MIKANYRFEIITVIIFYCTIIDKTHLCENNKDLHAYVIT